MPTQHYGDDARSYKGHSNQFPTTISLNCMFYKNKVTTLEIEPKLKKTQHLTEKKSEITPDIITNIFLFELRSL